MEEKIRIGINQFVKMAAATGFDLKGKAIKLKADLDDRAFEITTVDATTRLKRGEGVLVDIPNLPSDEIEASIELAGVISQRATRYLTALKANAGRSATTRTEAAKKAIQARWQKGVE